MRGSQALDALTDLLGRTLSHHSGNRTAHGADDNQEATQIQLGILAFNVAVPCPVQRGIHCPRWYRGFPATSSLTCVPSLTLLPRSRPLKSRATAATGTATAAGPKRGRVSECSTSKLSDVHILQRSQAASRRACIAPAARSGLIAPLNRTNTSSSRIIAALAPATALACVCVGRSVARLGHAPCQGVLYRVSHLYLNNSAVLPLFVLTEI